MSSLFPVSAFHNGHNNVFFLSQTRFPFLAFELALTVIRVWIRWGWCWRWEQTFRTLQVLWVRALLRRCKIWIKRFIFQVRILIRSLIILWDKRSTSKRECFNKVLSRGEKVIRLMTWNNTQLPFLLNCSKNNIICVVRIEAFYFFFT